MAVWFCILSAALGAAIAFCVTFTLMREPKRAELAEEEKAERSMAKQMENFFNYSGSGKGQVDIED